LARPSDIPKSPDQEPLKIGLETLPSPWREGPLDARRWKNSNSSSPTIQEALCFSIGVL
jgi:hypothetical protein